MNIIIDGHSLHVLGGVERTATDLASNLVMRGHKVFYFLTEEPPVPPLYPLHPDIKIVIYTHNGRWKHLQKFKTQILSCEPDVCISPTADRRHFPWCVALQDTGIPLIISEQSSPYGIENEQMTRQERLAILEAADGIRILLPSYAHSLPVHLQAKTHAIHNAVNLPKVDPIAHSHPTIITMGRLSSEKQNHLLIQAFALLHKQFPQWRVEIWGAGPEKSPLEAQIKKLKLQKYVLLKGLTKEPEQCFARADIACLPSRYEGFPGAVAQGMTAGLPVVGFLDCPGTNEMIEDGITGYLAPTMDAQCLADALRPLMQDENLRKTMGLRGQEKAKTYTPDKVFDLWEGFLQEVYQKKNATFLQKKEVQNMLYATMHSGIAKRINMLVAKNDLARAVIFQFPRLKRFLHPYYLWFKCRFLQ